MSEAANTLQSSATSRVVIAMSEGEIGGLVAGEKSIYFGDTPLMAPDGTYNFQGVTYEMRTGTADQGYMPGFPDVENDKSVEADVTYSNPITRRIDNASANAVRVRIQLSQGLMSQSQTTGDLSATSVGVAIDVRPSGGDFTRLVSDTISGKTNSAYERTYRVELPGKAPWDIRVSRLTADSESVYLRNATRWASYTEIVDRKCTYPFTATLGVAVDGKKFGSSMDTISADLYGRILRVPSNYDPATRAYTGIWDGTFKLAWSDNPAWCFYDMVTSGRYGLGIADAGLKWSLYEIAQYCDELVPDGFGGMEPRFTCNLLLNTQEDAYNVISSMASIFRGMAYWSSGSVVCTQDRPDSPTHLVTPAHVVDGSLSYSGTDLKSRHTVAMVTWNDPSDGFKTAIEVYEDPEGMRRYGWRQTDKIAVGCTSRGMARRCGAWAIESELRETDTLSFTGGFYYADAVPGCILKVMDPEVTDVRNGGAVKAATVDGVTLDAPVLLESGQDHTLSVVLPDKTVADIAVRGSGAETSTIAAPSPLSQAPVPGAPWVLSSVAVQPRYFRVVSNRETKPNQFVISAIEHDPTKYQRVEQGIKFDAPSTSRTPTGALAAPAGLSIREYIYSQGTGVAAGALLSWTNSADSRVATYEGALVLPSLEVRALGTTSGCSFDLRDLTPGVYSARVRAISRLGVTSGWRTLANFRFQGLLAPLPDVTGLTFALRSTGGQLDWDAVSDLRPLRYAIRRGAQWDTAQSMGEVATPGYVPLIDGTYLVKATTGQAWSANAAVIVVEGARPVANVIAEHDQAAAGWPGQCSGGARVVGDEIQLVGEGDIYEVPDIYEIPSVLYLGGVSPLGAYQIPEAHRVLLAAPARVGVAVDYTIRAEGIFDDIYAVPDIYEVVDIYGGYGESVTATPQIRLLLAGVWGDWQTFTPGEYYAAGFDFRMVLTSARDDVTVALTTFKVLVDVPDRIERGQAQVPVEGLRITYSKPFQDSSPSVFCQILGAQGGEVVEVTDSDATGCTVRINCAGSYVDRIINWITQSY